MEHTVTFREANQNFPKYVLKPKRVSGLLLPGEGNLWLS
jgi:hypothetical protein